MNRYISSLFLICMALKAGALTTVEDPLPSDRSHWSASVCYDATIAGKWNDEVSMSKFGGGVSLGLDYTLLLPKQFLFEPGIRMYYDTFRYDNITVLGDVAYEGETISPTVHKTGIRIPMLVGYKLNIFESGSLYLSTGPEPALGFTARTKVDKSYVFEENQYKNKMRRYDVAWDIRGSIILDRFRVDITGAFGLLDVMKTNVTMHEYRISIGVGYIF